MFVRHEKANVRLERAYKYGGANRSRTGGLMNAIHALYQLSYSPIHVG